MKKVKRMLAWFVALILVLSPVGINPIYVNADGAGVSEFAVSISLAEGTPEPESYGVEWEIKDSHGNQLSTSSGQVKNDTVSLTGLTDAAIVIIKVASAGKEVWINGAKTSEYDGTGKEIEIRDLVSSYEFQLKEQVSHPDWTGPMEGFPTSFGTGKLTINARNRVDMDNMHNMNDDDFHAQGEFFVEELPSGLTLNDLFANYSSIDFKAKIVENTDNRVVKEIIYGFQVRIPGDGDSLAKLEICQGYPDSLNIAKDTKVTFPLDIELCAKHEAVWVNFPEEMPEMTYNDIKDLPIASITADFELNDRGTVSYVAPEAEKIETTGSNYLNIVIPAMKVKGNFESWGGWTEIKALYDVEKNLGTKFTTYKDLFSNYKGIKIKVDISNIDPQFNQNNEIFFYLHDPLDGKNPGTVDNGVKYDITGAHANNQYVNKDGGVQEFIFDFADAYYMYGGAAPDIWLCMGVESRPTDGEVRYDVNYCDIKPVIESASGTISLGTDCSMLQFEDTSNTVNGGLMDVEKATKISLNVSKETIPEGTGTDKQEELKSLIKASSDIGTDDSATEQIKQVMEIHLSVGDTEIQPKNNKVKVSIPLTQFGDVDPSKMKLYHHVNGSLVEITGIEVKDGMVSFDTPSFSYFVVVEDSSIPDKPDDGEEDKTSTDTSSSTTVDTKANTTQDSNVAINTSNAGGYGRELASSMLINDINAAAPGTTLVIDRRYNRQYLSNAEMRTLLSKQTVTLCMQYNYNGVEYITTIPAGTAIDDAIPYYGPLYLAALYSETCTMIAANGGVVNTSNAGGFGRELTSSMLISDIEAAIPGTTLVIDRRYNRQYLTNAEMMALVNKQTVSLRMQYNYNGVEYDILIPAGVGVNNILAYYGPLYLAAYYH